VATTTEVAAVVGGVWRRESPYVLAALLRRHGDLGECEDAAQEALEAAVRQWPADGVPDNPRGWLVRVASRRLVDRVRSRTARERRELADATALRVDDPVGAHRDEPPAGDDTLRLMLLCCDGSLSRPSQVALTLRCVAGLTTEQVAAAYLVPTSTMAQRLSRARATLRDNGIRFELPSADALPARVGAVLDVCHALFTQGYALSGGDAVVDADLAAEAVRVTRLLHAAVPDHAEVAGALALMLLTHARTPSRTDAAGDLVPLREQDRTRWDVAMLAEGRELLERTLPRGHVGRYQLEASIAAVHADARTWHDTDWPQITLLYAMLHDVAPSPAVTLNRAVAVAMSRSPQDGLDLLAPLLDDPAGRRLHRVHAVRAHLLEDVGDAGGALAAYREAARLTASRPEQRYLRRRADRLAGVANGPTGGVGSSYA
jgi:RNA polymerase sigma factor (sigma-70 family)